jgi:glycosyltransferase involved in cell wall biosynthesis
VQQRYPDATLTLVGSGSGEASLKGLASDLKLSHVHFTGAVRPQDIWRHYADADIYIQTPAIDNMPASILEAFASGCPVVSTAAGGVPAIVTDRITGRLVPPGDVDAVAHAVIELLEDPGLAGRIAEAARASCEGYRWSAVEPQWLALYRRVVERASEPRERATPTERAGAAASERACRGVRRAKPLG